MDSSLAASIGVPGIPLLNRHFEEHSSLFDENVQKIRQGAITNSQIDQQFDTSALIYYPVFNT